MRDAARRRGHAFVSFIRSTERRGHPMGAYEPERMEKFRGKNKMPSLSTRFVVVVAGLVLAFALPASAQSNDKEKKAAIAKTGKPSAQSKVKRSTAAGNKNNIGEDPDPFIAQQLRRQGDPSSPGY